MILTKSWLKEKKACESGILWYENNNEPQTVEECLALLISQKTKETFRFATWLLFRVVNETNFRKYQKLTDFQEQHNPDDEAYYRDEEIFAARAALPIFEEAYPEDKRPRRAIEAAEGFLAGTVSVKELAKARAAARAAYNLFRCPAYSAALNALSIILDGGSRWVEVLENQE
jgi:hypothetical protein